jgi:shikimate kinase
MIQLIGPGGAGKTTTGAALADRLKVRFVDLDTLFVALHGDVGAFIDAYGYGTYAARNVEVYRSLDSVSQAPCVLALSSGFMVYPDNIHPGYPAIREAIASSLRTFLLLPASDLETCVSETVRRQLQRPFARTSQREEQVIRQRFPAYCKLAVPRIMTDVPVGTVVETIVDLLGESEADLPHVVTSSSSSA